MRGSSLLLWACVPLFNTLNQACMKLTAAALQTEAFGVQWLAEAVRTPYFWGSLTAELINFVVWLAILKRHALGVAYPLSSISYVTILAMSWLIFHETLVPLQLLGMLIILAGIIMLGRKQSAMENVLSQQVA